jgi:hypothetical protein
MSPLSPVETPIDDPDEERELGSDGKPILTAQERMAQLSTQEEKDKALKDLLVLSGNSSECEKAVYFGLYDSMYTCRKRAAFQAIGAFGPDSDGDLASKLAGIENELTAAVGKAEADVITGETLPEPTVESPVELEELVLNKLDG